MKLGKSRLFALAAAHGASLLAVPAVLQAAENPAATGQLEEIVVTARQREEKIEDVPVTITAFTQTEIKNAGIERPQDFIALTSGVSSRADGRGRRHAGQHPRHQHRPRRRDQLRARHRRRAADQPARAEPGTVGRHADRNPQGPAGRPLRPQCGGRRDDHHDPQAGRRPGARRSRRATAPTTPTRPASTPAARLGEATSRVRSRRTRATPTDSARTATRTATTASTSSTNRASTDACCFRMLGGDLDFKAKYSKIELRRDQLQRRDRAGGRVRRSRRPAANEDPNEHNFRYLNNIKPKNEQENVNLSLKGDWDVGVGTLTSYLAYNDQTNYFLTDGTSAAFEPVRLPEPGCGKSVPGHRTCQATNDAHLDEPGYRPPFFGGRRRPVHPGADGGSASCRHTARTTCDGYQYQQRDQKDTSIEVRLSSPGDQRLRWVGGVYFADIDRHVVVSQGCDLNQGFQHKAFVPTGGPNPDRPAVRRRLQQQGVRGVRPAGLRRGRQPRTRARAALRQ